MGIGPTLPVEPRLAPAGHGTVSGVQRPPVSHGGCVGELCEAWHFASARQGWSFPHLTRGIRRANRPRDQPQGRGPTSDPTESHRVMDGKYRADV
jgi:hypothetical protein